MFNFKWLDQEFLKLYKKTETMSKVAPDEGTLRYHSMLAPRGCWFCSKLMSISV